MADANQLSYCYFPASLLKSGIMTLQKTTRKDKRYSLEGLTPIIAPVPPMLEKAIGYSGEARFVSFHWTPGGDEAYFDDGQSGGTGNWQGYLAYVQHPTVHPLLAHYDLGNSDSEAHDALILDRQERRVYIASIKDAGTFLAQQWPKVEPIHLTKEEWEAMKTRIIAEMKQKQQNIDMDEIHRQIEEQYALVEALQNWLNKFLPN
jgi:predicted DNA-binding protein (UPF0251 family)